MREKCYLHNHWSLRYNNLCEEKNACLNSCINLFYCKINSFFTCTDLIVLCIWIWPMIIIQQLFFFSHYFPKKFSWGQNKWSWLRTKHTKTIQQQYNLLFKPLQIPFTLTLRLWDIFILEGEKILTGMAYNIIKLHRSKWNDKAWLISHLSGTLMLTVDMLLLMKCSSLLIFKCLTKNYHWVFVGITSLLKKIIN